ncbi:MAG: Na/Pi cotransporter family protein [Gammaproteobacteria bacterium]|nr:Na/Pi cotransporter family protein [Gammaproteobacteria bacterium]
MLIWGLKRVQQGMKRAFGGRLTYFIRDRFAGVWSALGLGVMLTLILQSSTASALLAASLGVQGEAGLALLLGADVGTTLVALILSFDLSALSPLLVAIGVFMELRAKDKRQHGIGEALMGLGLMLLALGLLRQQAVPLQGSDLFSEMLRSLIAEPWLAIVFAALLTFLLHSSLVMVLLLAGLVGAQVIGVESGLLLILGVNIGSAGIPVYLSRKSSNAKRVAPLGNLILRTIGAMAFAPWVSEVHFGLNYVSLDPAWQVVLMHCLFNVVVAAFGMLIVSQLAGWIDTRLPRETLAPLPSPKYLKDVQDTAPSAALANVVRDTLTMGELLEEMLREVHLGMTERYDALEKKIHQSDDIIDDFHQQINAYLLELGGQDLTEDERHRCQDLLLFITNIEHAGDTLERSMTLLLKKKNSLHIDFTAYEHEALDTNMKAIFKVMPMSFQVMMSEDVSSARGLIQAKHEFNTSHQQYLDGQQHRAMQADKTNPLAHSLFTDLMRDIKRLHSHFTAIAYPVLNREGELRTSRWRGYNEPTSASESEVAEGDAETKPS